MSRHRAQCARVCVEHTLTHSERTAIVQRVSVGLTCKSNLIIIFFIAISIHSPVAERDACKSSKLRRCLLQTKKNSTARSAESSFGIFVCVFRKFRIMLKNLFYGLIKVAVVWSLATYFSVLVCFFAAKDCILRFNKKPWSSKKREEAPQCLKDPKYGVHKYVRVDVSSVEFCYDFLATLCSEIVTSVCDIVCYHFCFVCFVFSRFSCVRREFVCITLRMAIEANR